MSAGGCGLGDGAASYLDGAPMERAEVSVAMASASSAFAGDRGAASLARPPLWVHRGRRLAVALAVLVVGVIALAGPAPAGASSSLPAWSSISTGMTHTCAVTTGGAAMCWGNGYFLGNGSFGPQTPVPVSVSGLGSGVAAISAGYGHTCALKINGAVKCWGSNTFGELGDGTTTDSPVPVAVTGLGSGVTAITTGESQSCALTNAGAVKCWGLNDDGRLGATTTQICPYYVPQERLAPCSDIPVAVTGLASGATGISAGGLHTCAVTGAGAAKCWGNNDFGQLGDGSTAGSSTPVAVSGLASGVAAVSAGYLHSCAVTTAGAAKCWGFGRWGQLGDGMMAESSSIPVDVSGLGSGVAAINAGGIFTCARTSAGAVKCWGINYVGQLGNGTTETSGTPVGVSGLGSGVAAMSTGSREHHTCVVTNAGLAKCWGGNAWGELGDGTGTDRLTPVAVSDTVALGRIVVDVGARVSSPFTVTATAQDAFGAPLTTYNGAATWSDSSGTLAPSTPSRFVDGISTTMATVHSTFTADRITITSNGVSGTSGPFNTSVGPFAVITFRLPARITAGVPFIIRAYARDAGGILTSYNAPATWSDLAGKLSPATPGDFFNGV